MTQAQIQTAIDQLIAMQQAGKLNQAEFGVALQAILSLAKKD